MGIKLSRPFHVVFKLLRRSLQDFLLFQNLLFCVFNEKKGKRQENALHKELSWGMVTVGRKKKINADKFISREGMLSENYFHKKVVIAAAVHLLALGCLLSKVPTTTKWEMTENNSFSNLMKNDAATPEVEFYLKLPKKMNK
ncbi:CLUMA_CG008226, isoform A [Clunio marinus]|uniref:CLUMA_CG008226, isoform A n=1 Tax=Clunio marinus TaxID=568069 RepID=A0A1J1I6Z7_9DIPT|nr:CLUMA_CG008226, isoform A [Clunio marinus]